MQSVEYRKSNSREGIEAIKIEINDRNPCWKENIRRKIENLIHKKSKLQKKFIPRNLQSLRTSTLGRG
jgi:hypothetical protein